MPFRTEPSTRAQISPEIFAVCLLLAASLQIMENLLPKVPIFPWLRLGLSYLIMLPFMIRFGVGPTLWLFLCRNLISLIYGGQIFSSFLISTLSGLTTLGLVGPPALWAYRQRLIGLVGFSILLATVFNLVQLQTVFIVYIRHGDFFFQLPPMLIWSVVTGGLTAFLIHQSRRGLAQLFEKGIGVAFIKSTSDSGETSAVRIASAATAAVLFIVIIVLPHASLQLGTLLGLLAFTRVRYLKALVHAWPFLFFIAWLHLFRTDGVYLYKDWITREGLNAFLLHSLRTVNLILCGQWLAGYIPGFLRRRRDNPYLEGMMYALPLLPVLFGLSIAMGRAFFKRLRQRRFDDILYPIFTTLGAELARVTKRSNGWQGIYDNDR
jgi:uncharacterized membrane protein